MFSGLFWTLLCLLVVMLLVLSTPVEFAVGMRTIPSWRFEVVARPLGGFGPRIVLHDSARQAARQPPPSKPEKARGASGRRGYPRLARAIGAAPRLMADLLRSVRLERVAVDADVGLSDPAETGQLYGLLATLRYARPTPSVVSVDVRPDFTGPCASGELDVALSVVPFALLPPGIRFAWQVFRPA